MSRSPKAVFVAEIDEEELACRILENFLNIRRPPGVTAKQLLEGAHDTTYDGARRAARAALEYYAECIKKGVKPS